MGLFKFGSEDMISRMPENVITNVLDRLPIQEAVRTSILSRNWRFGWTLHTQLVFDDKFFRFLQSKTHFHLFYKRNLGKLLLQHKGSITKFVLYVPYEDLELSEEYDAMRAVIVEDINHWILFLSTKGIKEFTLINSHYTPVKLPNHLFSCLELKHLELDNCCLHPVPGFHCFPKLLSFDFRLVTIKSRQFWEIITLCPLLENLEIGENIPEVQVKLNEIAKLVNLKIISLRLEMLADKVVSSSDIFQLIGSLQKLEKLYLDFGEYIFLAKAPSKRFLTSLHCLKTLVLKEIRFKDHVMVECACDLINGLPNVQTLKMTHAAWDDGYVYPTELPVCSIKGNLQLQYVEFDCYEDSEIEVQFIESLLAYCPLLKTMVIKWCWLNDNDGLCMLARKLLTLHRASPKAEIYLV